MLLSGMFSIHLLLTSFFIMQIFTNAQEIKDNHGISTVFTATLGETDQKTPEISTKELKSILNEGNSLILDTRPHLEWAISHIPGALNVSPKPGMPMSLYTSDVAEIERLTNGNKTKPLILYCNGPYCGKSKRVADDLLKAGYTDIRRYQLGAPVWRALGEVMETEPDGIRYIFSNDKTAVFIDARNPEEFNLKTLPGSKNIPYSKILPVKDAGEVKAAKNDGRLPMEDHNTRIVVFGLDGSQAKEVAKALAKEAFHNVTYFNGTFDQLEKSIR